MQHKRLLNPRFCNGSLRRSLSWYLAALLVLAQLPAGAQELAALQKDPPPSGTGQTDAFRPLQEVLKGMESKFGIYFMFDSDQLKDRLVNPAAKPAAKVEEQLRSLLEPAGLRYKKVGSIYVITAGPNPRLIREIRKGAGRMDRAQPETARLAALATLQAGLLSRSRGAAEMTVAGRVTDDKGEGLPGVNVLLKGTNTGTTTNGEGSYALTVPDGNGTLVFSYIGYVTEEVAVGNRTALDVSLVADIAALSEVVVVGYGTQKRSDLTGSVSSVKAEDVKNLPVRGVAEALQGRAAGVQITRNDGAPGAASDIVIRGAGSVGGMAPLYIVDGIRMSPGNNFNLQDVESIEVLKDASAAAIYGAQAAGGVVLVTTKRGAGGDKMDINFNAYYGFRQPLNLYSLLNTNQYFQARQAFGANTSGWGNPAELPDTDWVDELFGTGREQSYSLSLSGASDKVNYYVSANYQREDGVRIDNRFERYGLRANADYKISKRLKVGETLFAWRTRVNPSESGSLPFRSVPAMPVRDAANPFGGWGQQPDGGYFGGSNAVADEYIHHQQDQTYALEGNIYADWEIINGLNFRSTFGASVFSENNYDFREAYNYGSLQNTTAALTRDNNDQQNLTANFVLTYGKTLGRHEFKAMAGYEAYREDRNELRGEAQGFQVITQNLALSTDPSSVRTINGGQIPRTRLLSQFGRINYAFAGKYLLTANIRRDGSDRFGPANKWGVFPSVSVGWKISEEAFMQPLRVVSNLKLRASYGRLGSTSNIPQFTYQASFGGDGGTNIHGLPDGTRAKGYALTAQLPNSNIKWEEVDQADIGVDVGLWNNRLTFTADWYSRQTNDMIYQVPVPNTAGFDNSTVYTNIGQMSNRGVELAAEYRGKAGAFTYSFGANASFNRNEVKRLDGTNNNPINDGSAGEYLESTISRTEAGRPLSQFYGYVAEGLFGSDAEVAALNQQAQESASDNGVFYQNENTGAGDLRFRDLNGDGRITADDRTFIGNPWPKMTYGLTLNLGWRGFDVAALLQGIQGVDLYNGTRHFTQFFAGDYNTTGDIFGTSFFNGNGLTDKPRVGLQDGDTYVRDPNSNYTRISSYYVENGAYLKLRNLQVGYTLPQSVAGRVKLSNVRVYLQGQNLLTFTKYSGMDPEVVGNGFRNGVTTSGTTGRGIDTIGAYPRTRLYSMGIDVSF